MVQEHEYKCPRCNQGILVKRKGKNGEFWGCSNFPNCRMTCNDVDGKPDIEKTKFNFNNYQQMNYNNSDKNYIKSGQNEIFQQDNQLISAWDLIARENTKKMNFAPKEKFSAMPIEKNKNTKATSKYLCTRCKEGNYAEFAVKMVGFGHVQIILIVQLLMMIIMEFLYYKKLKIR